MFVQQFAQAAPVFQIGIDEAAGFQQMMQSEAHDMEPIGNDEGFGEVGCGNGAIGLRQVHADDADTVFAFHLIEIIGQRCCRAAGSNVEDTAPLQVAKGGRKPHLP